MFDNDLMAGSYKINIIIPYHRRPELGISNCMPQILGRSREISSPPSYNMPKFLSHNTMIDFCIKQSHKNILSSTDTVILPEIAKDKLQPTALQR